MALSDTFKKAVSDAAYAVGYGVGKAGKAVRDASASPAARDALATARGAVARAADATESFADRVAPTLREFADRAAPAVQSAADKTAAAVKGAAQKAEPAVRQAAASVGSAAAHAAEKAGASVKKAGSAASDAVRQTVTKAAVKNAADMQEANPRPHEVVDPTTGQPVVVEAYVINDDGSRDYGAVYPKGALADFGPLGNKAVGFLLILAGIPMLVLPGPGVAAIGAGLYFLGKDGAAADDAARRAAADADADAGRTSA